ncbi:MAG: dephospho-CoA kinase [Eubacteriales bacterium]
MYYIGITGGVGSGKSSVLAYLEEKYECVVVRSDDLAAELTRHGQRLWQVYVDLFGPEVIGPDGEIDRKKVSSLAFGNKEKMDQLNERTHPVVREEIAKLADEAKREGRAFFVLESAVLIEEKYNEICDELWYVYADEKSRRRRLSEERGYSEERITRMMKSQLPDEKFREMCDFTLDNSGDFEATKKQIDDHMIQIM